MTGVPDNRTSDGRAIVLASIRANLRRGKLPPDQAMLLRARLATHPRHLVPARARGDRAALLAGFAQCLRAVSGSLETLADVQHVPAAIAAFLAAQGLGHIVVLAPHPELGALDWAAAAGVQAVPASPDARTLAGFAVGVQQAAAGIAETGTLMLPSGIDRPALLNMLPGTLIVVLRASRVVGGYEDAFDLLRDPDGRTRMPRSLVWVTGPSRSADIEQTLELGAHGPQRLHVLLIGDDPVADDVGTPEADETHWLAPPAN